MSKRSGKGRTISCGDYSIPELTIDSDTFIDKSTALYGPSGTGKSVFVKHIINCLCADIEQAIVVNPTESSNKCYTGTIAPQFIHATIGLGRPPVKETAAAIKAWGISFFTNIIDRQKALVEVYMRVNNLENLQKVFSLIPEASRIKEERSIYVLGEIRKQHLAKMSHDFGSSSENYIKFAESSNASFTDHLRAIYKSAIVRNHAYLWSAVTAKSVKKREVSAKTIHVDISTEVLSYINLNPRLLLIFDDCAAMIKPYLGTEAFRALFYQGRHMRITTIFCLQDDTDLGPNLRKNVFYSIFTTQAIISTNFSRPHNYPKDHTKKALECAPTLFSEPKRKMIYRRDDPTGTHFYHATAQIHPAFKFGSEAIWELCSEVQRDASEVDSTNPYAMRLAHA